MIQIQLTFLTKSIIFLTSFKVPLLCINAALENDMGIACTP